MTLEKIKQLVAAAVTFGVLAVPGFSDFLHSVGGQAEVLILTGALWTTLSTAPSCTSTRILLLPGSRLRARWGGWSIPGRPFLRTDAARHRQQ